MMRSFITFLAVGILLCVAAVRADDNLPYLATITVDRAPGTTGRLGGSVVSTLHVVDAKKSAAALSSIDGLDVLAVEAGTVQVRFDARPTIAGGDPERFLGPTWVIDFDEAVVRALADAMVPDGRPVPSVGDLERFVFEHIADKTYSRGFDLASRVAARGEGDCTEHAVLLTALARSHNFPARVVFGNILVETPAGLFAFGHAWTEIHDGERWQVRDATMPGETMPQAAVHYIPFGLLRNEGPAYAMSMFEIVTGLPNRISGVADST